MLNYPPGVTGNEPEIAGYPPCGNCGCEADDHSTKDASPCYECGCQAYTQGKMEQDPDEARDYQLEREYQRRYESYED